MDRELIRPVSYTHLDVYKRQGISKGSDTPQGAQEVSTDDGLMTSKELLNYEDQQKAELEKILSKMSGVGEVIVNIYFESGEIQVPATNSSTQTSETQEEDTNGGTRAVSYTHLDVYKRQG